MIFSILLGLVMAAVGFDIISGKPRLIFFDLLNFKRNRVLVLAIGIYGIGEMLWTIESTKGKVEIDVRTWARFLSSMARIRNT